MRLIMSRILEVCARLSATYSPDSNYVPDSLPDTVACASMRIVVSQVCGLLSVAYSASFWLRATMRRHTYSAVQPVPSMCCFSTYLLSAFVEYASCLQLYTMCLIEEYARKSYNKPNYKAHSFAVRRMRRRCRRCGLMCVCVCHLPTRAPQNTSPWWRKPRRQRVGGGRFAKAWEAMRCRGGTRRLPHLLHLRHVDPHGLKRAQRCWLGACAGPSCFGLITMTLACSQPNPKRNP